MSNDLQLFDFQGVIVRILVDDQGDLWWVASDVAKILDYRDAEKLTRMLEEDEKGTQIVGTPGGSQLMSVISEEGLYRSIMISRVSAAKPFQHWVTHEVLPQIRKTGAYGQVKELTGPELMAKALIEANKTMSELKAELGAARPKAAAFDVFLSAAGDWSINEAAKMLCRAGIRTGAKRLTDWMLDNGWLYRGADHALVPYQPRINTGYLTTRAQRHYHPYSGELVADRPQVRVTPKGLDWLCVRLGGNPAALQEINAGDKEVEK